MPASVPTPAELRLDDVRLPEFAGREITVWAVPGSQARHGGRNCRTIASSQRVGDRALGAISADGVALLAEEMPRLHCSSAHLDVDSVDAPLTAVVIATRDIARAARADELLAAVHRPDARAVPEVARLLDMLHADWQERHFPYEWYTRREDLPDGLAALRDRADAHLDAVYSHVLVALDHAAWRQAVAVHVATELVVDWSRSHRYARAMQAPSRVSSQVMVRVSQLVEEPTARISEQVRNAAPAWPSSLHDAVEQVADEAAVARGLYLVSPVHDPLLRRLLLVSHPHRQLPLPSPAERWDGDELYLVALPGLVGEPLAYGRGPFVQPGVRSVGALLDTDDVELLFDTVAAMGYVRDLDTVRERCGLPLATPPYGRHSYPQVAPGAQAPVDQQVEVDVTAQLTISGGHLAAIGERLGLPADEPDTVVAQLQRAFTAVLRSTARDYVPGTEISAEDVGVYVTLTPADPSEDQTPQ